MAGGVMRVGLMDIVRDTEGKIVENRGLLPDDDKRVREANRAIASLNRIHHLSGEDYWPEELNVFNEKLKEGNFDWDSLTEPKTHWHPDFKVVVCGSRQELYERMGQRFAELVAKHDRFTLPWGPVPFYDHAAAKILRDGTSMAGKRFDVMDMWVDRYGRRAVRPEEPGAPETIFGKHFIDILAGGGVQLPSGSFEWPNVDSYRRRVNNSNTLGVLLYGIGAVLHIAFREGQHGIVVQRAGLDFRNIAYLHAARLAYETLIQNKLTGAPFGVPSQFCDTPADYMLEDQHSYGLGGADGFYKECGEGWQIQAVADVLGFGKVGTPGTSRLSLELQNILPLNRPTKAGELYVLEGLVTKPVEDVH